MQELFDLTGKVAVVTGSSRGIGKAIAERLAEAGANVVISSRKAPPCDQVASDINARTGRAAAIALPANISDKGSLQAMVDATLAKWGRIDILVCNAATNPYYGPMDGIDDDVFRKVLDNNVLANHWLVQMVGPQMKERKDGAVIIVSSIGGLVGSATIGAYNISKAADMQMARNLAVELGPHNIRVNCIAPGLIKTDFSKALWNNEKTRRYFETATPLRRIGDPDEIAGAAVFLSSRAGAYMTGQVVVVDGGATVAGG
ncbi:SDR family oxidoreductase [Thalassovita sp.]|uniref:SDR family NAD(P)-dependent oxidoreductase n=1 Tax=Thalassovita sp. TaxID=1979401 RepID=UPI0029DE52B5|nr:SDR family oxidoreductase [Thalassovita sp.]